MHGVSLCGRVTRQEHNGLLAVQRAKGCSGLRHVEGRVSCQPSKAVLDASARNSRELERRRGGALLCGGLPVCASTLLESGGGIALHVSSCNRGPAPLLSARSWTPGCLNLHRDPRRLQWLRRLDFDLHGRGRLAGGQQHLRPCRRGAIHRCRWLRVAGWLEARLLPRPRAGRCVTEA